VPWSVYVGKADDDDAPLSFDFFSFLFLKKCFTELQLLRGSLLGQGVSAHELICSRAVIGHKKHWELCHCILLGKYKTSKIIDTE
jgi:hypothetical protein